MNWIVAIGVAAVLIWFFFIRSKKTPKASPSSQPSPSQPAQSIEPGRTTRISSLSIDDWPKDPGMTPRDWQSFESIAKSFVKNHGVDIHKIMEHIDLDGLPFNLGGAIETIYEWWNDGTLSAPGRLKAVMLFGHIQMREWDVVRQMVMEDFLQDSTPEQRERLMFGKGAWATDEEVSTSGHTGLSTFEGPGTLILGYAKVNDVLPPMPLKVAGPSHVVMFAATEVGKNQHFIMPNLMAYNGPVVVLDPKGENYDQTAWFRSRYGNVYKFAPWDEDSDCFNPLDFVSTWDDAFVLAELMIPKPEWGEKFWNETAQSITAGLIYYIKTDMPPEDQNLEELFDIFHMSESQLEEFVQKLQESPLKEIRRLAHNIADLDAKMRQSIWQSARTELRVWASPEVSRVTKSTSLGFSTLEIARRSREADKELKSKDSDEYVTADSIYVSIPADKIETFAQLLRLVLGTMVNQLTKIKPDQPQEDEVMRPFLFIFDELAQLGYMALVQRMMPIARGYNMRLWLVFQNLGQLTKLYPQWESIIENAHAQVYFGDIRGNTAEYLSKELGTRTDILGNRAPVISPQSLSGPEFQGRTIVRLRKMKPILGYLREPFFKNEQWQDIFKRHSHQEWEAHLKTERASRPKDDPAVVKERENMFMKGRGESANLP